MAKIQEQCNNCGKKIFVNKVKVYVLKLRYCPTCDIPLFCHNNEGVTECLKCGLKVDLKDSDSVARLKLEMKGTTRKFTEAEVYESKGYEIQRIYVPEKHVCNKCQNLRKHIQSIVEKQENISTKFKGKIREMSDADYLMTFFKHIQKKLREENPTKGKDVPVFKPKILSEEEILKKAKEAEKKLLNS